MLTMRITSVTLGKITAFRNSTEMLSASCE